MSSVSTPTETTLKVYAHAVCMNPKCGNGFSLRPVYFGSGLFQMMIVIPGYCPNCKARVTDTSPEVRN